VDASHNGYIDFGWDNFDNETMLSKRTIELNNGYTNMLGILGLMVHKEVVSLSTRFTSKGDTSQPRTMIGSLHAVDRVLSRWGG
jgi:hypothetical protein